MVYREELLHTTLKNLREDKNLKRNKNENAEKTVEEVGKGAYENVNGVHGRVVGVDVKPVYVEESKSRSNKN